MAEFDLVIRGGLVADGNGGPPFDADVGVRGGLVREIGAQLGTGTEEIDARGKLVTPGFVDVHTHYDGQVVWDSRLAPSSYHGVTTVVMGNCGVGFAPVRQGDHDRLIELMEGVEDIPGVVLAEGLTWKWESVGEYLDVLAARSYDIDVVAQIPHAPLRVYVMGERACRLEPATEQDVSEMRRLAAEAIRAGAIGFSTSRSLNHKSIKGEPTPSLKASEAELLGIARGIADGGGGVLEIVTDDREGDFAMARRIVAATGIPLSLSLGQATSDPDGWRRVLALIEEARADGLPISAQVAPRTIGAILTIEGTSNPFLVSPAYREVADRRLPLDQLAALLREPGMRELAIKQVNERREEAKLARFDNYRRLFLQTGPLEYEPRVEASLACQAERAEREPLELLYDHLTQGDGTAFAYFPVINYAHYNLGAVREMLAHPHTVIGLGDGGAHVGLISDASFPTFLLSRWSNARHEDGFDLGWLVKRHTLDTARLVGLTDRGVLAPGMKADINVIDLDRLALENPVIMRDLPAGGSRLLQRAQGYVATIVAGEVIYRDGVATGALPGRLVRAGQN